MEIDRRKNFRFSEWAPEGGTLYSKDTESEGTETPILGISSSELHNELFSLVMKTYAKQKQCGILQLLQQKCWRPELESQLEEPWLRDYKDNKSAKKSFLTIHPTAKDFHDMWKRACDTNSKYIAQAKECHKQSIKIIGKNAVGVGLTEEFSRKHPVCPVNLVKTYFQTGEGKFPSRKKTTTLLEIVEVEDYPGSVNKIIKARKINHNGKDQRQYLVRFKKQTADKDKWLAE
ncbi:hypothetical protein O181_113374 [Austropuccinia psidii MF-1]|uniref:Uncharacterized protein n=1 Tax=Austropuccinia psidii MF-1 TaxID=1389203 RepID=A0A9Q3K3G6_9BASI|nr:hypothetical protein [Austropuccinia psidii MF-1]